MTCPAGHATTHYTGTREEPRDLRVCATCRRAYAISREGVGLWIRLPGYCDGCDQPTWRILTHDAYGPIVLWPKPDTLFPLIQTPHGPGDTIYRDYCPTCCPAFGAFPARIIGEIDGHPIVTGACIGYHPPPLERYAARFTDQSGADLRAWLRDHVGLEDAERETWLTQWHHDRTWTSEGTATLVTETPHG